jgi:dTDP-4-amino-4,6-dideoxygalactose transaminase
MSDFKVKFIDYPKQYQEIKAEMDLAIQDCLGRGDLILRQDVERFEQNLARYLGVKHAVGLNSGTDALIIALKALGIGPGDEVITSGHTFWATVEAILHVGATPILVGINRNLTMDLKEAAAKITSRTKAIIPVHLAGSMVDMHEVLYLANCHDLKIVEDACQALGAKQEGISAGAWGDAGCFSFYPAKILGAYGDAGALVTDNEELAEEARRLRNHGNKGKSGLGYNSRLDNLQAAILNVKFKHLDDIIARRKQIAEAYDLGLSDCEKLTRPESREVYQDYIIGPSSYWLSLQQYLKEEGIETLVDYYDFPMDVAAPDSVAHHRGLRLPIDPCLTDDQIAFVIKKIIEFYAR